jgi:hypothetical protein
MGVRSAPDVTAVLVHSAFADPSLWSLVVAQLLDVGETVVDFASGSPETQLPGALRRGSDLCGPGSRRRGSLPTRAPTRGTCAISNLGPTRQESQVCQPTNTLGTSPSTWPRSGNAF